MSVLGAGPDGKPTRIWICKPCAEKQQALRKILPVPQGILAFPLGGRLLPDGVMEQEGNLLHHWRGPKELIVVCSSDPTPHGRLLHVSMSYSKRDPDWAVIKAVRKVFFPETVDVMMMLPKAEDYINVHEHCFHIWECPKAWNVR